MSVSVHTSKSLSHNAPAVRKPQSTHIGATARLARKHYFAKLPQKPSSLLTRLNTPYQQIFKNILHRPRTVDYRGQTYQAIDHGDYVIFRQDKSQPKKARLVFHGLQENQMHLFPGFTRRQPKTSFEKYYAACLQVMDSYNFLDGSKDQDIIWHRGYWGEGQDKAMLAPENKNAKGFLTRKLLDFIRWNTGDSLSAQFDKRNFVTDVFAQSAAHSLKALRRQYDQLDILTHSMGNATFLEALDILNKEQPKATAKKADMIALLTHPVYKIQDAIEGGHKLKYLNAILAEYYEHIYNILNPLTEFDPKFKNKEYLSEYWIYNMLDAAVDKNMLTQKQKSALLCAISDTQDDISSGVFSYEKLNKGLKQAFPLIAKQHLVSRPSYWFDRNKIINDGMMRIMRSSFGGALSRNMSQNLLVTQPFCVSPFYNQAAKALLNKQIGVGKWRVISGEQDQLAPHPQTFLPDIFGADPENKNIFRLAKRKIYQEDISKLKDKNIVLLKKGIHGSAVTGQDVLPQLLRSMRGSVLTKKPENAK
ncbi:MAG: hypothetical protein AAF621_08605 [Pseudomonadota bacterium]